jgi:hypothetical protein
MAVLVHDVVLLDLAGVEAVLEDAFDDFGDDRTDLDIVVEEVGFGVVAGLAVVEDVGEEDDFELVEVEGLGDVQQQVVGVVPRVGLRHLVQDLVGLVGEPAAHVLPLQLLVAAAAGLGTVEPPH